MFPSTSLNYTDGMHTVCVGAMVYSVLVMWCILCCICYTCTVLICLQGFTCILFFQNATVWCSGKPVCCWVTFGVLLQVTQVRVKFLDDQNRLIMRNVKGPVREGEEHAPHSDRQIVHALPVTHSLQKEGLGARALYTSLAHAPLMQHLHTTSSDALNAPEWLLVHLMTPACSSSSSVRHFALCSGIMYCVVVYMCPLGPTVAPQDNSFHHYHEQQPHRLTTPLQSDWYLLACQFRASLHYHGQ